MINGERSPCAGVVARFTHGGGIDVGWGFTACADTIVALHTVSGYTTMVECCPGKAGGVMAGVTLHGCGDVIDGLTARGKSVVATRADTEYLGVVNNKR